MLFRRPAQTPRERVGGATSPTPAQPRETSFPSLAKALQKVLRLEHPCILDLGSHSGHTPVMLAALGARVTVDDYVPPRPPSDDPDAPPPPPIAIDQPDASFDLVLGWETLDHTPPDRIAELLAEMHRTLRIGGWLVLLSRSRRGEEREAVRFRLGGEDRLIREPDPSTPRHKRYVHPTRSIERALRGYALQGVHLQRDQTREILAVKTEPVG